MATMVAPTGGAPHNTNSTHNMEAAASAQQGRVTGIIIPPPEIRAVVDKTANYAAKFGKSFEQKLLNSEEGKTAKFNFMRPFDPYHAYYEFKIK
jgi:splicing factor 3A subunit 1